MKSSKAELEYYREYRRRPEVQARYKERGTNAKERKCWENMKRRCLNPKDKDYHRWGARGITICERWMIFENFIADIGPRPRGMSLDRINNNGPYSPENCRWATPKMQSQNSRTAKWITFEGQSFPLHEWSRRMGLERSTIGRRLRTGWTIEEALTTGKEGCHECGSRTTHFKTCSQYLQHRAAAIKP